MADLTPPPTAQFFSISCSFWENLAKLYVDAPHLEGWLPSYGESWIRPCTSQCRCLDSTDLSSVHTVRQRQLLLMSFLLQWEQNVHTVWQRQRQSNMQCQWKIFCCCCFAAAVLPLPQLQRMGLEPIYLRHHCCNRCHCCSVNKSIRYCGIQL